MAHVAAITAVETLFAETQQARAATAARLAREQAELRRLDELLPALRTTLELLRLAPDEPPPVAPEPNDLPEETIDHRAAVEAAILTVTETLTVGGPSAQEPDAETTWTQGIEQGFPLGAPDASNDGPVDEHAPVALAAVPEEPAPAPPSTTGGRCPQPLKTGEPCGRRVYYDAPYCWAHCTATERQRPVAPASDPSPDAPTPLEPDPPARAASAARDARPRDEWGVPIAGRCPKPLDGRPCGKRILREGPYCWEHTSPAERDVDEADPTGATVLGHPRCQYREGTYQCGGRARPGQTTCWQHDPEAVARRGPRLYCPQCGRKCQDGRCVADECGWSAGHRRGRAERMNGRRGHRLACDGKVMFRRNFAEAHARQLAIETGEPWEAYKCKAGGHYHVAHVVPRWVRLGRAA